MKVISRILPLLLVFGLLQACAPTVSQVLVRTDPPGGRVVVADQEVADGNTVQLAPGTWEFVGTRQGYRDGRLFAEVAVPEDAIVVPLGEPFGQLKVVVTPSDAHISISGGPSDVGPELHFELSPGPYEVTFTHPDYPRVSRHVDVYTGEETDLVVEMADSAPLVVNTGEHDAVVFLDGVRVGSGTKVKTGAARGAHKVEVVSTLNGWQRRYGVRSINIEHETGLEVDVEATTEQWRFEGRWVAAGEARRLEQARYAEQAVIDPAMTRVTLGADAAAALRDSEGIALVLHASMRVGDAMLITLEDKEWLFAKRDGSLSESFEAQGQAFNSGIVLGMPWSLDPPLYEMNVEVNRTPAVALAAAALRTRLALPLASRKGDEVGAEFKVERAYADGAVSIFVSGGEELAVNGNRVADEGPERVVTLSAEEATVTVTWTVAPEAVAATAERKLNQLDWRTWESLLRGGKRLGAAFESGSVIRIERVSKGPEYPETEVDIFEATGPLAREMSLHMIDLGPHDVAGDYHRSWRFSLEAQGRTQRQLDLGYLVSTELLDTDTRNFLRREAEPEEKN